MPISLFLLQCFDCHLLCIASAVGNDASDCEKTDNGVTAFDGDMKTSSVQSYLETPGHSVRLDFARGYGLRDVLNLLRKKERGLVLSQ